MMTIPIALLIAALGIGVGLILCYQYFSFMCATPGRLRWMIKILTECLDRREQALGCQNDPRDVGLDGGVEAFMDAKWDSREAEGSAWYETLLLPAGVKARLVEVSGQPGVRFGFQDHPQAVQLSRQLQAVANSLSTSVPSIDLSGSAIEKPAG